MKPILTIAQKDLRLLLRDPRSAVILFVMPLVMILVLGLAIGDAFGRPADNTLRISVVDEDTAVTLEGKRKYPPRGSWSEVVIDDLSDTGNIRVERIGSREEAARLVSRGDRAAVVVFGPQFSGNVDRCSFVGGEFKKDPINPLYTYGIDTSRLDIEFLENRTQPIGSAVIRQVTQVSLFRVVIPWMIGQAFDMIGGPIFMDKVFGRLVSLLPEALRTEVGKALLGSIIKKGIADFFRGYDFTALNWADLTKDRHADRNEINRVEYQPAGLGFDRGAVRYQVLVPSHTVTFAFFLVLSVGWLFVAERRHGTLVRLRAAPLARWQILLGKWMPCLAVSLFQGFFLLLCGKLVFGMSWGAEPWLLVPVVVCTSLAAVGLAMLVAGLSRTETQVAVYGTLLVVVLAGLSGSLMPRDLMPEQMKQLSLITPHAWALEAYSQLLRPDLAPSDATVAWRSCGMLLLFATGFTLLAWWRLRLD